MALRSLDQPNSAAPAIDSYGDHRIAMAFSVAALIAEGETEIKNSECVAHLFSRILRTAKHAR